MGLLVSWIGALDFSHLLFRGSLSLSFLAFAFFTPKRPGIRLRGMDCLHALVQGTQNAGNHKYGIDHGCCHFHTRVQRLPSLLKQFDAGQGTMQIMTLTRLNSKCQRQDWLPLGTLDVAFQRHHLGYCIMPSKIQD